MFSIPELRRKLVELRGTWKPFGIELMVYADPLSETQKQNKQSNKQSINQTNNQTNKQTKNQTNK